MDRKHKYSIHGDVWYCQIVGSSFVPSNDNNGHDCLHIKYVSDGPGQEHIEKFIQDEYPELSNRKIKFIYSDFPWLSNYNGGDRKGCFTYYLVFFE